MQVLNIFHVLVAIAMVAFILLQRGPGATAGAAFGSGASGTVFGSRGAGSFMSRSTWILAALFCLISLTMAVIVSRVGTEPETDLGVVGSPTAVEAPVAVGEDLPAMDDGLSGTDLPPLDAFNDADSDAAATANPDGDLPVGDLPAADLPVIDSTVGAESDESVSGETGTDDPDS
jgi:preprotein translocase subunit SecG